MTCFAFEERTRRARHAYLRLYLSVVCPVWGERSRF